MKRHLHLIPVVLTSLAGGWLLVHSLKTSLVDFARVTNESMLPYLRPQQILVIAKTTPCLRNPLSGQALWCTECEAGKAYVFRDPRLPARKLVKFALAAPSGVEGKANAAHGDSPRRDIIWFTHGAAGTLKPSGGDGFCYFEGSNREQSVDSRHFGPVRVAEILGKVIYPDLQYRNEAAVHSAPPVVSSPQREP